MRIQNHHPDILATPEWHFSRDQSCRPAIGWQLRGIRVARSHGDPGEDVRREQLTGLHPDRVKPINFLVEENKRVGFLDAFGDDVSPYTVREFGELSVTRIEE